LPEVRQGQVGVGGIGRGHFVAFSKSLVNIWPSR
jgi:hypothetical protein